MMPKKGGHQMANVMEKITTYALTLKYIVGTDTQYSEQAIILLEVSGA